MWEYAVNNKVEIPKIPWWKRSLIRKFIQSTKFFMIPNLKCDWLINYATTTPTHKNSKGPQNVINHITEKV